MFASLKNKYEQLVEFATPYVRFLHIVCQFHERHVSYYFTDFRQTFITTPYKKPKEENNPTVYNEKNNEKSIQTETSTVKS
jgi:hypothetical protein|tara:strand:+ start:115 stop:357 length:243 start_codon:yes stop_codon:yes gene_type:complete